MSDESSSKQPASPQLLSVRDLVVEYPTKGWRKQPFRALNGVTIDIAHGETLGLVGESGSGKSTLGRALLGLAPITSGQVTFEATDISRLTRAERRAMSTSVQVVFQDPYTSLNPAMSIGDILTEPLRADGHSSRDAALRVRELLDMVHLPGDASSRYPREFSGGQRQRIAIARALSREPHLIVCDEPVSALDLTTQTHVLDLFIEIQQRTGVAYLFITHDLSVVRAMSHRVAVMHGGEIVETGSSDAITSAPQHPYTQRLLLAAPVADPARQAERRDARRALTRA